jgi:prepilin-type N-terminal cleavage/methylation domain-containing protein
MQRRAFTLVELIFVIVIIGILSAVAIPRFTNLTNNAKVSSELSTASAVETAIESAHSEWIVSDSNFYWGANKNSECTSDDIISDDFNCTTGYPQNLGVCPNKPFIYILKNGSSLNSDWNCSDSGGEIVVFKGPASKDDSSVKDGDEKKPDECDYWEYNRKNGTFKLIDQNCS